MLSPSKRLNPRSSGANRPARRPSIAIVSSATAWGGAERHTCMTIDALAAHGCRVVLLQLGRDLRVGGPVQPATGEIVDVDARLSTQGWRLVLHRLRVDIVVQVKGAFDDRLPALDRAMWTSRRRFVVIEHSLPPDPPVRSSRRHLYGLVPGLGLWYWRVLMYYRLHRRAQNLTVAVAASVGTRLAALGYSPTRIVVAPNGVDTQRFRFDAAARDAIRRQWGVRPDATVIGSIGRLSPEKRIDRLIAAFGRILAATRDDGLRLVIVGDGPSLDALRLQADRTGHGDRIIFAGPTSNPELSYSGFDMFALTSEIEGMPYTLLEAMAASRIVVAMSVGDIASIVEDGFSGRVTAQEDAAYDSALEQVIRLSPEQRRSWGARARQRVIARHEYQATMSYVVTAIAPALGGPPVDRTGRCTDGQ